MNQSRYGVLVSLILLLALTGGFFVAARFAVQAVKDDVAKAVATATVVVVPPTPSPPPPSPTPPGNKKNRHPTGTGPAPTATPASNGQIVVSTSNSMQDAASTLPATLSQYWCLADLPNTPLSALIVWRWEQVTGNSTQSLYTSNPYTYASAIREGYLDGPLSPGQYRCEVLVNEQLVGFANFTVH